MEHEIYISLYGENWIDRSNCCTIGNGKELIKYVNRWKIRVINEDCFLKKHLFFYNKLTPEKRETFFDFIGKEKTL